MEKLSDSLRKDHILVGLEKKKKKDIFRELIRHLSSADVVTDEDAFIDAVLAREKIQSTGIGGGVAIPHARAAGVRRLSIVMGRYEQGVDFAALDGKPVQLIFLIAAPPDAARAYLQTVAKVARLLKTGSYKEKMLQAAKAEEIADLIEEFDRQHPGDVRVKRTEDGRVIHPE